MLNNTRPACVVVDASVWAGAMTGAESLGRRITTGDHLLHGCRAAADHGAAAGRVIANILEPAAAGTATATRLCLSRQMQDQLTGHLIEQGLDRDHAVELTGLAAAVCEATGGTADLDGRMSAQYWVPASLLLKGFVSPEDIAVLSTAEAAIALSGGPVVLVTADAGLCRAARVAAGRHIAVVTTNDYAPAARRPARV